jgi:hypothetical protein
MLTLDIKTNIDDALKQFYVLEPRHFPFIVALAMNRTMKRIKDDVREEMARAFDRPKPFTLNSLQTVVATKQNLEASIKLRDFAGKGTPASKYLAPTIYGGKRSYKGFERQLQRAGILPAGMYAVPSNTAPLDQYGGVSGSLIVKMLSYLKAFGEVGYTANRKPGARKAQEFFAITTPDRGLPLGIYQRKGKGINMLFAFVKQPTYSKQFRFFEVSQNTAQRYLNAELIRAADYALQTSKSKVSLSDFTAILK